MSAVEMSDYSTIKVYDSLKPLNSIISEYEALTVLKTVLKFLHRFLIC